MKKRISIDDLRPGMYVASLDQSWFKTPFLRHFWQVKRQDEIQLLRNYGIQELIIDTSKGLDVPDLGVDEAGHPPTALSPVPDDVQTGETTRLSALGPDLQELEIVRSLRADAIQALDSFFELNNEVEIQPIFPRLKTS